MNVEQYYGFLNIFDEIEKIQEQTFKTLQIYTLLVKKVKLSMKQKVKQAELANQLERNIFDCYFCKEQLKDQQSLFTHYIKTHNTKILHYGPNRYTCRMCFQEYRGLEKLLLHEKNDNHSRKKQYKYYTIYQKSQM